MLITPKGGFEAITPSYNKIMSEFGLNEQAEIEQSQRKIMADFLSKARAGLAQGRGRFAKKFKPTAAGFNEYILADAAYNLDQGAGGKTKDDQAAKGMQGLMSRGNM